MGNKNTNLHRAKKAKNDEFYTLYEDIEKEVENYREQLKGLSVYCPCDDPDRSNFYKYFKKHFTDLGIRSLTATCYIEGGRGKYARYDGENEERRLLEGDGDFRSAECTALMKSCDIVITNPPFSLFRDFIKWLEDGE